MSSLNQQIITKISEIIFPNGQKLSDLMSEIIIKNNNIGFSIDISNQDLAEAELIRQQAINKLSSIAEIDKITIVFTKNEQLPSNANPSAKTGKVKLLINNVGKIILVAAGKGGVGKSTIAALIAEHLTRKKYAVGIVDADIYGPSIPQIFNVSGAPSIAANKMMMPLKSRNIQIMSIGFLVAERSAVAWRGPMASKAIYQLLSSTLWDRLDYLIIDMPPGTGDIHLAILENYHIDGVVVVTTPQQISKLDVQKAIDLYKKFNLKILGIIENMSYFIDSKGRDIKIFAGTSGYNLAQEYSIPFICQLPLMAALSEACDRGTSLADVLDLPIEQLLANLD
jgi:ATP-binding protein involved in chromosome partitioning